MVSVLVLLLNKSKSLKASDKLLLQIQFIAKTITRIFELYMKIMEMFIVVDGSNFRILHGVIFQLARTISYNFMGKGLMLCYHALSF